ncbi:glycosyltransferase [Shigella flexneri]
MLTDKQIADFQKHYQTEAERFIFCLLGNYLILVNIASSQPIAVKSSVRRNGITEQQYLLLQVGSDFTRKVSIVPFEAHPAPLPDSALRHNTLLICCCGGQPENFEALAEKRGVRSNVHFFSGRNDAGICNGGGGFITSSCLPVSRLVLVLLEAITAGLPVLTTAVCGYAHYIVDANCGEAIAEPFRQETLIFKIYAKR